MSKLIAIEKLERGISAVVLNRPERRNALCIAMLDQLQETIEQLASDRQNRVIILRGAGSVFSAGLDLHEAADDSLTERSATAVQAALRLLQTTPLILIAAVHGGAYAGGAGMMAACDIAIATANARFGFPEARRGLLPALIFGVLKNKIREGDLRELFLAGETIDATRALQIGLVQRVVAAENLMEAAQAVARSVMAGAPETICQTKAMFQESIGTSTDNLISKHLAARNSVEAREGLRAFIEKREPRWP